ncbi:pentapeptide repeat-containing protein [Tolypothrix bouteillei VB521301_2]|uniref:pentapeptide repeat-containing protein n=1 Tax=Tolypothrix bouteillei TaxID=1246981 RepID=UPI0038B4F10F
MSLHPIRQGIQASLGVVAVAVAVIVAAAVVLGVTQGLAASEPIALAVIVGISIAAPLTVAVVAGITATAVAGATAVAVALVTTVAGAIALATVFTLALNLTVAVTAAIAIGIAVAVALVLLSIYISRRSLKGDPKYALIRDIAIAFAAFKGTSFRSADLTDANFTGATLKSTDFRKAILTCTCFHKTKKLDRVRPGTSYLRIAEVRQVLVTGQGQDKNFDRIDLRGINFKNAHLVDASFIGADLSEANLQDADLSRAKLVQTQLDATDLTGATLTGAIIEDWNITSHTKLHGVRCEYVYMRLPTKDNLDPLRKPDNNEEIFADGEFGNFIQPIFDTLDLYHNQGVDPRAIAVAFKELAENNPNAELEIVAIERRGDDKILLRAKTAASANKSELSKEYFINYNQLKTLAEKDFQVLIAEKELQIHRLEIMITTALERPIFYTQGGDIIMSEGSKQQFNNDLRNAQIAGGLVNADTVTANQIGGNITNYTQEQKQNLAQAASEIQQLLFQLSQANPTDEVVTEAIHQEIKRNPTLKSRLQSALKAGGLEALKAIFNHPLFSIPAETVKGWLEAE